MTEVWAQDKLDTTFDFQSLTDSETVPMKWQKGLKCSLPSSLFSLFTQAICSIPPFLHFRFYQLKLGNLILKTLSDTNLAYELCPFLSKESTLCWQIVLCCLSWRLGLECGIWPSYFKYRTEAGKLSSGPQPWCVLLHFKPYKTSSSCCNRAPSPLPQRDCSPLSVLIKRIILLLEMPF